MIKVNVGMSRKVSKDYNSTGFSLNLEGEVALSLDDPNLVIERIKQFYDLAEESLALQVERYEHSSAIPSREVEPTNRMVLLRASDSNVVSRSESSNASSAPVPQQSRTYDGRTSGPARTSNQDEMATNKQLQFLMTLGKRRGMNSKQLEELASKDFGPIHSLYDLTKQQAGSMITELNQAAAETSRRN